MDPEAAVALKRLMHWHGTQQNSQHGVGKSDLSFQLLSQKSLT
jgi:hypothetical protein